MIDHRRWARKISVGVAVVTATAFGLTACSGSSTDGAVRTVQVDHQHDEFAGTFMGYYPRIVTVRPGDTVRFRQTWTGEPHTVTMGTYVQKLVNPIIGIIDKGPPYPSEPPPEAMDFDTKLPGMFPHDDSNGVNQNAAQPCFLDTGSFPDDPKTPCPKRAQPEFNGRQSIYSSGFIPYLGAGGNTFEVKLAKDASPGNYFYYCNIHGPLMSGHIVVAPKGTSIPSQGSLDRQGRKEIEATAKPLLAQYNKEKAGQGAFKGNLAGSGGDEQTFTGGSVDEFTPRTIKSKVGEKVTWTFVGGHTVSFNVPKYFPLFSLQRDGNVVANPAAGDAVRWPTPPKLSSRGDPSGHGPPPPPIHIDAGSFDGSGGLHSSGGDFTTGDTFSVTFTKAGTFLYACLIHPAMIAKVVVQ